jgi:hypothetical protein
MQQTRGVRAPLGDSADLELALAARVCSPRGRTSLPSEPCENQWMSRGESSSAPCSRSQYCVKAALQTACQWKHEMTTPARHPASSEPVNGANHGRFACLCRVHATVGLALSMRCRFPPRSILVPVFISTCMSRVRSSRRASQSADLLASAVLRPLPQLEGSHPHPLPLQCTQLALQPDPSNSTSFGSTPVGSCDV